MSIFDGQFVANSAREIMRIVEEGIADPSLMPMIFEQNKFIAKEQFRSQDTDSDGFITYEEFRGPKEDQEFEIERDNYAVISPQFDNVKTETLLEPEDVARDEL